MQAFYECASFTLRMGTTHIALLHVKRKAIHHHLLVLFAEA